jgi:hypothetical protein
MIAARKNGRSVIAVTPKLPLFSDRSKYRGFYEGGVAVRSKVLSTMAVGLALSACAGRE